MNAESRSTRSALKKFPLPPADDGDKETKGRILIIAGSRELAGAALLVARSAMRAGAGKLRRSRWMPSRSALRSPCQKPWCWAWRKRATEASRRNGDTPHRQGRRSVRMWWSRAPAWPMPTVCRQLAEVLLQKRGIRGTRRRAAAQPAANRRREAARARRRSSCPMPGTRLASGMR